MKLVIKKLNKLSPSAHRNQLKKKKKFLPKQGECRADHYINKPFPS